MEVDGSDFSVGARHHWIGRSPRLDIPESHGAVESRCHHRLAVGGEHHVNFGAITRPYIETTTVPLESEVSPPTSRHLPQRDVLALGLQHDGTRGELRVAAQVAQDGLGDLGERAAVGQGLRPLDVDVVYGSEFQPTPKPKA